MLFFHDFLVDIIRHVFFGYTFFGEDLWRKRFFFLLHDTINLAWLKPRTTYLEFGESNSHPFAFFNPPEIQLYAFMCYVFMIYQWPTMTSYDLLWPSKGYVEVESGPVSHKFLAPFQDHPSFLIPIPDSEKPGRLLMGRETGILPLGYLRRGSRGQVIALRTMDGNIQICRATSCNLSHLWHFRSLAIYLIGVCESQSSNWSMSWEYLSTIELGDIWQMGPLVPIC